MPWIQVSVTASANEAECVEDAMQAGGAVSVTLMDAYDTPVLEPVPGEIRIWNDTIITGLFEADANVDDLRNRLQDSLGDLPVRIEALPEQDWERAWMDNFKPMAFGQRLWVVPRHMQPPEPDAVILQLDPGLAFGTGTHPTTALCLRWLDAHPPSGSVLDYGCGSGILAIAALLLGAAHADAGDIDEQALQATRDNARENRVVERLHTALPELLPDRQYDLVMANILSQPLIQLAPLLAARTQPGGDIILSGILKEQADEVVAAYLPFFDIDTQQVQDEWVLLHGRR